MTPYGVHRTYLLQYENYKQAAHLRSVVYANLNESTLLIVEYTVVGVLPVPVVVELHSSSEALGILR